MKFFSKIRKAEIDDCGLIRQLASRVWEPTYGTILSEEQLDYMFDWMYSTDSLQRQMESGHVFFIITKGEEPAGYISIEKEGEGRYHLQKIYILPEYQGFGLGRELLKKAEEYVRSEQPEGLLVLVLNVNRSNPARFFYEKMGFSIESEGDFDIGNGFFMNDYIMVKHL